MNCLRCFSTKKEKMRMREQAYIDRYEVLILYKCPKCGKLVKISLPRIMYQRERLTTSMSTESRSSPLPL